jgi:hypothetical protein
MIIENFNVVARFNLGIEEFLRGEAKPQFYLVTNCQSSFSFGDGLFNVDGRFITLGGNFNDSQLIMDEIVVDD